MRTVRWFVWLCVLTVGFSIQQAGVLRAEGEALQKAQSGSEGGFTVFITLSERAKKDLVKRKETIVVAAYVTGLPKRGALKRYLDEMGTIDLGGANKEIVPGEHARFSRIPLNHDAVEQTDKKDPQLLINVFSGRRSAKDNLLNCGIYQGSFQAVQGHTLRIACKLIGE